MQGKMDDCNHVTLNVDSYSIKLFKNTFLTYERSNS